MKAIQTNAGQQSRDVSETGMVRAEVAEKWLIGVLLGHYAMHISEIGDFDGKHLFHESHQLLFRTMRQLADEQIPVDAVSVANRLTEQNTLDDLPGGVGYLLELMEEARGYPENHVGEWCRILVAKATIRKFQADIEELGKLAAADPDIDSLRARGLKLFDAFPAERRRKSILLNEAVLNYVDSLHEGIGETLRCGIPAIDSAIGGAALGELVVIGARPSQGKSLLARQWIDNAAAKGIAGLLISEEMTSQNIAKRTMQSIMPFGSETWGAELDRVRFEVREHFKPRAPIIISEHCGTMDNVERAVADAVRKHEIRIVAIDYAQLIKGEGRDEYSRLCDVSTRSKRLAAKHEVIVLLLVQLGRDIDKRADKTPLLSDLKGSGQFEQDADVILFPMWPFKFDPTYADPTEYRVYQGKNRSRGIGEAVVALQINTERQRIEERARWADAGDEFN